MLIQDLVTQLFGDHTYSENLVDRWKIWELPRGYATTLKIEELLKQFKVFGLDNVGGKLIIAKDHYVTIKYPSREDKTSGPTLGLREDNLRPVFLNDLSEEGDLEASQEAPKLRYGYIWREQLAGDLSALREKLHEFTRFSFNAFEIDDKSWILLESTMLNKQDPVPQLRITLKEFDALHCPLGKLIKFSAGFIALDKDNYLTIAIDQAVSESAISLLEQLMPDVEEKRVDTLLEVMELLMTPITVTKDSFQVFEKSNAETAVLSAIGNNV